MSLPTSRNRTYTPNDPVYSADLNAIQDAIIATHSTTIPQNTRHGDVTRFIAAMNVKTLGVAEYPSNTFYWTSGSVAEMVMELRGIGRGDRVKSIAHYYQSTGSPVITLYRSIWGTTTPILENAGAGWLSIAPQGGAAGVVVNGSGTPLTIASDTFSLVVHYEAQVEDDRYYGALVTWDHP